MTHDLTSPPAAPPVSPALSPEAVDDAILRLAAAAGPGKTIAPGDVAHAVAPGDGWQRALPQVRRSAVALAQAGRVLVYRKGKVIDPAELRGVYRLGLPREE